MAGVDDQGPIETRIINGLANRVANYYIGNFLNRVLGGGGSDSGLADIRNRLRQLAADVQHLREDFSNFAQTIIANQAFMHAEELVRPSVTLIEGDYDVLSTLDAKDTDSVNDIKSKALSYHAALKDIHNVLTGDSLSGGNLLSTAATMLAVHATTKQGYSSADGASLLAVYQRYENFFRAYVATQVKAAALTANAFNGRGETQKADDFTGDLPGYVLSYVIEFLNGVQHIVAAYHHDDTLLDMLMNDATNDPLRAAQVFVQRYPSARVRRLWQWIGTGAGFDVAAGNTLASTETLKLRDGGGANVVLNAEAGPSTYSSGGDAWTAVRFAIPAGTSGLYTSSSAAVNASVHQNTVQPLISPPRIPLFDTDMISVETAATSINIRAAALDTQSALLPEGSAFTIECWCRPAATGGVIFTAWWDRGSDFVYRMNWATFVDADYTMKFGRWGVGDDPVLVGLINSVAPDTAWHHVALTYDGGQNLAWYFDGKWMGHYEARLGYLRPILGGMGAYRPPLGFINEFRIWNRTFDADGIQANMHRIVRNESNLVAVYGFDRGNCNERRGARPPLVTYGDAGWVVDTPATWLKY